MNKYMIFLSLFAFVSQIASAVTYAVNIQVSDTLARPIEGASVVFKCTEYFENWYDEPDDYVPRSWSLRDTDVSGHTVSSTYQCTAGLESSVVANYRGLNATVPVSLHSGTNDMSLIIEGLEDLTVNVQDQDSNPIKGVEVTGTPATSGSTPSLSGTTDEKGIVTFKQVPATADFILRLKNGYEEKTMEADLANQGTSYVASMSAYKITALVVDDLGKPINGAVVNLSSSSSYSSALTDSSGKAVFSGLKPWNYTIAIEYKDRMISEEMKVESDIEKKLVMDIQGPSTAGMRTEAKQSGDYAVQDSVCPFAAAFLAIPTIMLWNGRKIKDKK
ncbi:MAG: carboxypeptidase regulatory-like domain-containing protein [Candidatus Micrarchaeota archaeon]|nr:carboxypeptidase regulatory-like domain-containing protein [Candidatus Micrarchaeota archaeon]